MRIQYIFDELVILWFWIYEVNFFIFVFCNECINIDLEDVQGCIWYLFIVGGFVVGSIVLFDGIKEGVMVDLLEELVVFYLGFICCMVVL